MWRKLRSWFGAFLMGGHERSSESIQKLVTAHALNRRKNTRIKYAHIGAVGDLPRVFYVREEMNIGNISTGGLLIIDDAGRLGDVVGDIIPLDLVWSDTTVRMQARIVAVNLHRRHLQFVDFNANVFVRISQMVKPGFLGSKFRKVDTQNANITAEEIWISPTNESLIFHNPSPDLPACELHLNGETYEFRTGQLPLVKKWGQVISRQTLGEILVLLANFGDPSHRVHELIERLQRLYHQPHRGRTGTDG